MQMAAEAWPIGRIGILGQTKECLLERGPLSVRSCNCTKFVSHLVLVDCETFDGCEVTRAHHMEVLPTRSERSSISDFTFREMHLHCGVSVDPDANL